MSISDMCPNYQQSDTGCVEEGVGREIDSETRQQHRRYRQECSGVERSRLAAAVNQLIVYGGNAICVAQSLSLNACLDGDATLGVSVADGIRLNG